MLIEALLTIWKCGSTVVPVKRHMDKMKGLCSYRKERNFGIHNNIDKPKGQYVKLNKAGTEKRNTI